MSTLTPCVFVEGGLPGKRLAEALLRPYAAEITSAGTTSGTIGMAEYSLLEHPERPVAVLIHSDTENEREVAEIRGAAKRLLAGCAPENWYVAVAVPRLDAWALTDPRLKRAFDAQRDGKAIYVERATRLAELLKRQSFDATELYRTNADFRGLVEFLQKHAPAAAG
jgi:hypothetical protein